MSAAMAEKTVQHMIEESIRANRRIVPRISAADTRGCIEAITKTVENLRKSGVVTSAREVDRGDHIEYIIKIAK